MATQPYSFRVEVTCRVVPAATPWRLFEEDTLSMAVVLPLGT